SVHWAWCPRLEKQVQVFSINAVHRPICSVVMQYLLWTDLWCVTASCTIWLFYDWNTQTRFSCVRNWTAWTYYRDNVHSQLVAQSKLHPWLPPTWNWSTESESNGFSAKFPGITPFVATLAGNFHMPLAREYLVSAGVCPVNRATLEFILSCNGTGNAVIINVGGAAESRYCTLGVHCMTLKNRKDFTDYVVLCLIVLLFTRADLVPVYSFGENDVYKQLILNEGSWWRLIQRRLQKILGFAPCAFQGRGLFSPDTWGLVPFSKPINSVVGKPMEMPKISSPSQEELNHYHTMYMSSLTQLFDKHKTHFELREEDVLVIH
uniref:Acyltransferase n=1 Tax=Oncorhynchus kisutch TaxID=8019 RepID=A0A8C7FTB3_ONCKI